LKQRNASILGKLLNQNRSDLKRDCANILLKNIFDTVNKVKQTDPASIECINSSQHSLKIFGCLCNLAEFGPEMTQSAILPNFDQIQESFAVIEKMKGLGAQSSFVNNV